MTSLSISVVDNGFVLETIVDNDKSPMDRTTQVFVSPSKLLKVVRTFIEDHGSVSAPKAETND